jgi:two-component system alkaline phosphatase synthesis response regulator PhoP
MSGTRGTNQIKVRPKILWLEDDLRLVDLFKEEFETFYEIENIVCFADLKKKSRTDLERYEAILLDMELSDGVVGLSVIEYLKVSGVQIPILVLSNDESIKTKINTLKLGIEDYLWKAMHPEELLIRLSNAISRNKIKQEENKITLSGLEIYPLKFLVMLNQNEIELTKIELLFLSTMIGNYPNALTCDYLRSEVWRLPQVEIGTINTFIWKLNKKLNPWIYRISKDQDFVTLVIKEST